MLEAKRTDASKRTTRHGSAVNARNASPTRNALNVNPAQRKIPQNRRDPVSTIPNQYTFLPDVLLSPCLAVF